jgi:heme/copper-type cytochrome/quinol oxidase subunit 2
VDEPLDLVVDANPTLGVGIGCSRQTSEAVVERPSTRNPLGKIMETNHDVLVNGMGTAAILTVGLIIFAILLVPLIFYILTLQKAMNNCAPANRAMQPGLVWLLLIPCLGIIWHFFIVIFLAKSLGAELKTRGINGEPQPGLVLGLIMCALCCVSIIPIIGGLFGLGYLVCWIIYWIKIAGISKQLVS